MLKYNIKIKLIYELFYLVKIYFINFSIVLTLFLQLYYFLL